MERLKIYGLTINDKHEFNRRSVTFYGMEISGEGMRPLQSTTSAITNIRKPENSSEVLSFLSAANFYMRFIPEFATILEPLKELLRKGAAWKWEKRQ